ncbi:MAG TPA: DMT family transporter [Gemmatimonadales bacterium]
MIEREWFQTPRGRIVAGHAALSGVQLAFGLFPVVAAMLFVPDGVSPLGLGAWRIAGGAIVLGGFALLREGRRCLPARADVPRVLVCAAFGVVLNQGTFVIGLARSTPMNAGLVLSLIPVFTFAAAVVMRQEKFSAMRALGVFVALVGVAPLLFSQGVGVLGRHGLGNLLMAMNACLFSLYLVISKPLTRKYSALSITAWMYVAAAVCLPVFVAGAKLAPSSGFARGWWLLAYVIVFPTVLAYLLNTFALARVRASTTAVYVYVQPLITGIASWVFFRERPTPLMALSAAFLFVGIWLVARRPPKAATGGPLPTRV